MSNFVIGLLLACRGAVSILLKAEQTKCFMPAGGSKSCRQVCALPHSVQWDQPQAAHRFKQVNKNWV